MLEPTGIDYNSDMGKVYLSTIFSEPFTTYMDTEKWDGSLAPEESLTQPCLMLECIRM